MTPLVSTASILRWVQREVVTRNGPTRAYTGPYPDRSGPTMEHADRVADFVDLLEKGNDQ